MKTGFFAFPVKRFGGKLRNEWAARELEENTHEIEVG